MKQIKEMEDDREWRTTLILNLMKKIRRDKNLLIVIIVLQVKKILFEKSLCKLSLESQLIGNNKTKPDSKSLVHIQLTHIT